MKYKVAGIITCLFVLLTALIAPVFSDDTEERYHQHLEAVEKETCTDNDDSVFCTHLPLIMINTYGQTIPGKYNGTDESGNSVYETTADGTDYIIAELSVVDHETTNNHITDNPTESSLIEINIRGNSSRIYDKSNYRIDCITESGENNFISLLGMDEQHEWVLHGPFLDKTLIRNYMWYNISGEIMDYAPNVRFCEVYIDGEYMGVYVATENITEGNNGSRLQLSVSKKNNTYIGYLLRLDRGDEDSVIANTLTSYTLRTNNILEILYPGESNITPELQESITQDFSFFEKSLYSYDYDTNSYGYENFIDIDSFVDYFIINEFAGNYDAGIFSTYIYKGIDNKFRMCVWDFNSACNGYQESVITTDIIEMQNRLWYFMLMKDEDFTNRIVERYRALRKTYLSDEYLIQYIEDVIEYLGPAVERNFEKWGYTFEPDYNMLTPDERNPSSYDEAVDDMIKFLIERGAWLDENIETVRQYSSESKVKKFNENAN